MMSSSERDEGGGGSAGEGTRVEGPALKVSLKSGREGGGEEEVVDEVGGDGTGREESEGREKASDSRP